VRNHRLRLSPARLAIFRECPRCFWLEAKLGISRPKGPFSSLPASLDLLLKTRFDAHRLAGTLTPEFSTLGSSVRLFPDEVLIDQWRDWRTGLRYESPDGDAVLQGALDDVLLWQDGRVSVLDYKTRGFPPSDESAAFYHDQLNLYTLLLEKNGMRVSETAYLGFYFPFDRAYDVEPRRCGP